MDASRRLLPLAVLVVVLAAALPACGGGRDALTVYSGRGSDLVGPLLERFNAETGIAIDVRYGDSPELALLIDEEGEQTPADVFYSQSPGTVGYLAERDRLAALPDDVLDRVDPRFQNAEGLWVGLSGRQRVLVYNTDLPSEEDLPTAVAQVTEEPRYGDRSRVAPRNALVRGLRHRDAPAAGRRRDARVARVARGERRAARIPNNNAIVEAVSRGEITDGPRQPLLRLRASWPRTPTCRSPTTSSPAATSARS